MDWFRVTLHLAGATGERFQLMEALVDTGAPSTVFDRGAADAIGVRINNVGARTTTVRLMGFSRPAQIETVDFSLPDIPGVAWTADGRVARGNRTPGLPQIPA